MRYALLLLPASLALLPAIAQEPRAPLEAHAVKAAVERAPGGREAGVRLCWLEAHSRDRTATNLRAGPSRSAKVSAALPPMRREGDDTFGPEFQVIANKGDWFLIRGAHWAGYGADAADLALGPFWMAANLTDFTIWEPKLFKEPRAGADLVVEMRHPDHAWGPDSAKIERVHGCSGSYVDVSVKLPDGRRARGWASGLCANQVTSCGGAGPAFEERAGGLFRSEAACRETADETSCPASSRP